MKSGILKNRFTKFSSGLALIFFLYSCQNNATDRTDTIKSEAIPENRPQKILTGSSQTINKFKWRSELCEYVGYYENGLYSEKQLQDTYFLFFQYNSATALDTDVTLDEPELYSTDYIENALKQLEQQYVVASKKLKKLEVVPSQFWHKHKALAQLELEELYKLKRLTLEAHLNPRLLNKTTYSDECVEYVTALTAEDSTVLLGTWKKLVEYKKNQNRSPEHLEQEYQKLLKSKDRLLFARIDLMNFGWWNCANRQRKYIDGLNQNGQMSKEFNKLFSRIESLCND